MPRPQLLQSSFAGGELSPLLGGRVDLARWQQSARTLLNALPLPQGPAVRRSGTRHIHRAREHGDRAWTSTFVFSRRDAYVLEWGDRKLRFFAQAGRVLNEAGTGTYEIDTPYALADLTDADGLFALRFAQSGDRLLIAGGGRRPQVLERRAALDWSIDYHPYTGGPWAAENTDEAVTVHASAVTGEAVTLTASAPIFKAGHVNSLFRLFVRWSFNYDAWEASADFEVGDVVQAGPNVYEALRAARSGTVKPTHTRGRFRDGSERTGDQFVNGVDWLYRHSGYGWGRLLTVAGDGLSATMKVLSRLPAEVVGSANATSRWQLGAWSGEAGWPEAVAFFAGRLVMARGRTLWLSAADDFESFRDRSFGEIKADDGITVTLDGRGVSRCTFLEEVGTGLLVGTDGGEWLLRRGSEGSVLGAVDDAVRNVRCDRQTAYGALPVPPVPAHGRTLILGRTGRSLRELRFRLESDGLEALDLSALAEHALRPGVLWMAWQGEPDSTLWLGLADGTLAALTYLPEQELVAWSRHQLGGGGIAESGVCIPRSDGSGDELWLLVRRSIGGATRRYHELLEPRWSLGGDARTAARFLDGALAYSGPATGTLAGLDHLEGQTVGLLVDGGTHPDRVVQGGQVTLDQPATAAVAGLRYTFRVEQLPAELGPGAPESLQGRRKRVASLWLRLLDTGQSLMARAGLTAPLLQLFRRSTLTPLGQAPALFSGDVETVLESSWDESGAAVVETSEPLPVVLLALARRLDWGDR